MNIEIKIDENFENDKIIFQYKEMSEELLNIIEILKSINNKKLKVYLDEETYFISENDIEAIYCKDSKVYIKTEIQEFLSKNRLYEFESILSKKDFIKISNAEIVNINKVKSINTKIIGTIVITFYSGYKTYSSRRYIKKIKEVLDI